MKPVTKALLLALALVVFYSVAFCQDYLPETDAAPSAEDSFKEGTVAGKDDAISNNSYYLGGLLCGPLSIAAAAISDPQPDPQKVILLEQTKGTDYASAYSSSFSKESRKKNLIYAAAGLGSVIVTAAIMAPVVYYGVGGLAAAWSSAYD